MIDSSIVQLHSDLAGSTIMKVKSTRRSKPAKPREDSSSRSPQLGLVLPRHRLIDSNGRWSCGRNFGSAFDRTVLTVSSRRKLERCGRKNQVERVPGCMPTGDARLAVRVFSKCTTHRVGRALRCGGRSRTMRSWLLSSSVWARRCSRISWL